jgi:phosphate:Na+ symporter
MIQNLLFNLIGGLGIFLFGMKAMSEALQVLAGDRLRRFIGAVTDNRIIGVTTGLFVTMIVQSSSVTTVMVVSFVNAGLMTLMQAASVILGANIGTTITGWILVLKLHKQALPILGLGVFANLFAQRESVKFVGQLAMGFGMIFYGLKLMESGFAPLRDMPEFLALMSRFGAQGWGNLLLTVGVGALLTMIVQSSSAMLGITIALASVGLLDFEAAAALVLGENIGTTITAQLAALGATADGRRAAMFHSTVNVIGVLAMLFLFPIWIQAVEAIVPGSANAIDANGDHPFITAHIALAHSSFNIVMVLIALPLLRPIVRATDRMIGKAVKQKTTLSFLHPGMIGSPALAIEQGRLEVLQMAEITRDILHLTKDLFADLERNHSSVRERILKKEKITDLIQHEITVFMSRVMSGVLTYSQSTEVTSLVRLADEIESVADYCERMANYRSRLLREGVQFTPAAVADIRSYLDSTVGFYEEIVDRSRRGEAGWMPNVQTRGNQLAEIADRIREDHLKRLANQECEPTAGIIFSDIIVAMRRIRNHAYNMAEAFLGQK